MKKMIVISIFILLAVIFLFIVGSIKKIYNKQKILEKELVTTNQNLEIFNEKINSNVELTVFNAHRIDLFNNGSENFIQDFKEFCKTTNERLEKLEE